MIITHSTGAEVIVLQTTTIVVLHRMQLLECHVLIYSS